MQKSIILATAILCIVFQACESKIEFKDSLMEMNKPSYLLKDSSAWKSIEDNYFRLHVSNTILDSEYLERLRNVQQNNFVRLFKLMNIEGQIDSLPKIDIFIFQDIDEKYLKTQVKASAHALPPYYAAYYLEANAEGTHEIAHILTSYYWCLFSNNKFGMLLNEGFSFYSDEGMIFKFDYYEKARGILEEEKYKINRILSSNAGDSYKKKAFVSGAFVKYLIENYGIEKFKELWLVINKENANDNVFFDVYSKSIDELESKFYQKIEI